MGSIRISLPEGGDRVKIELDDLETPPAELQYQLLQVGAEPQPSGVQPP